jgi:hypothetical protein
MDRVNPHEHRTIHDRESASIDSAQRRGRTAARILWIGLMAARIIAGGYSVLPHRLRTPSLPHHVADAAGAGRRDIQERDAYRPRADVEASAPGEDPGTRPGPSGQESEPSGTSSSRPLSCSEPSLPRLERFASRSEASG